MPSLFDTHAHIDQEHFDENRAEVVQRALEAGVQTILAVGCTDRASEKCVALAAQFPSVYAAVGIQPNYVHEVPETAWDTILKLVEKPKVLAVGETGLDKYWDDAPFQLQQDYFDRHLRLSEKTKLPFIVHMRECEAEIMTMLREANQRGPLNGIMHSYTGPPEMAAECVAMGMYISFAGMITFKKSEALRACAATIPADRLLSPEPLRGKRPNEPARVVYTAACVAKARGVSEKEFAHQSTENAKRLFGLA